MNIIKSRIIKLTICPCGFHLLNDHIGIGTVYEVNTDIRDTARVFLCGKCGHSQENVESVFVRRGNGPWGMMPIAVLDGVVSKSAAN